MTAHAHPRASRVVLGDGSPLTRRSLALCSCPGNGAVSERAVRLGKDRAGCVAPPVCMGRRGAFSIFAAAGPARRGVVANGPRRSRRCQSTVCEAGADWGRRLILNDAETDRSGTGEPVHLSPTQDRQPQGEVPEGHGHGARLGEGAGRHLPGRPRAGHGPDQAGGGAHVGQPSLGVRLQDGRLTSAAAGPVRRGAVAPRDPSEDDLLRASGHRPGSRVFWPATSAGWTGSGQPQSCDPEDATAGRDRRFLRIAHGSSFADSRPDSGIRITKVGSIPAPKISCVTGCCGDTRNRRITVTSQRGPVASKDTAGGMPVARPAAGRQVVQPGDADPRLVTVNATASGWGPPLSMRPPFFTSRGHMTDTPVDRVNPQTQIQPRRQRWALPAGLTEGDLQRGYAQAVRP